jgi:hypothetical protein
MAADPPHLFIRLRFQVLAAGHQVVEVLNLESGVVESYPAAWDGGKV